MNRDYVPVEVSTAKAAADILRDQATMARQRYDEDAANRLDAQAWHIEHALLFRRVTETTQRF